MEASSKLTLAVVGTGHWGPNLIRNFFEDPRVDLKYICDVDEARAQQVASRFRTVKVTRSFDEILSDDSVKAVAICTPTNTHFILAKQCLERNKHVFIEKPMATTSQECQELNRIAALRGLKIMTGHVFLFNPAVQYVRNLIANSDLGDVIYIYGTRVNLGPIRRDVNALWDLAPHDIAICNYWLSDLPVAVQASGVDHINPAIHDVVFASLKYPKNIFVNLHVSWLDPRKIRQIVVVGTKRMVVFDDLDPVGAVHIYDKNVTRTSPAALPDSIQAYKAVIQEGDLVVPKIPASEPLRNECRTFVDCALEGKKTISDGECGLTVVKVLEALTDSLKNNGVETFLTNRPKPRPAEVRAVVNA